MPVFPEKWKSLKVVLGHDWLTGMRGGERVLEVLCRGFPEAPIYTLIHNRAQVSDTINEHPVHTSFLQKIPNIQKKYRYFLPIFPAAVSSLRLPDADLLITTSHCVAKGLKPGPGARHLCYCFTPMRYAWTFYEEYFGRSMLKAMMVKPILAMLRRWDRRTSRNVDAFVGISRHVQDRIRRFYGRDSEIVYPPVDTERLSLSDEAPGNFDLVVSALVPYKRVDLAVRAYTEMGWPLKVVGTGSESERLKGMAGDNVDFLGWCSDEGVESFYRSCRLLVFPGEEDFGIVPLEAQAVGRPVVAYRKGGAIETVKDGVSGCFFAEQTVESLRDAVERCSKKQWDAGVVRSNVDGFSVQSFIDNMAAVIDRCLSS